MRTLNRCKQSSLLFATPRETQIPCFIRSWLTLDDSTKVALMKIRFQADADPNQIILLATIRREPSIDFQTAQAAGAFKL